MDYERTARRDIRWWGMFLVGAIFVYASYVSDPRNCDESGRECAPWLVPIAKWMGVVFAFSGGALLITNPSRGSRTDPETGDLIWWQSRYGPSGGKEGRIHPSQISRIRIESNGDNDEVHLYDLAGERQAYFDSEVIPWPFEKWAKEFTTKWPHIQVENV